MGYHHYVLFCFHSQNPLALFHSVMTWLFQFLQVALAVSSAGISQYVTFVHLLNFTFHAVWTSFPYRSRALVLRTERFGLQFFHLLYNFRYTLYYLECKDDITTNVRRDNYVKMTWNLHTNSQYLRTFSTTFWSRIYNPVTTSPNHGKQYVSHSVNYCSYGHLYIPQHHCYPTLPYPSWPVHFLLLYLDYTCNITAGGWATYCTP